MNRDKDKKVIVITGASSGFGALTARTLSRAGYIVYAGIRETGGRNAPQVKAVNEYASEHKVSIRAIEMDMNSQDSIDSAIREILAKHTHIDVLIHNAGHMVVGPAEAFTPEQLAEMYNKCIIDSTC